MEPVEPHVDELPFTNIEGVVFVKFIKYKTVLTADPEILSYKDAFISFLFASLFTIEPK